MLLVLAVRVRRRQLGVTVALSVTLIESPRGAITHSVTRMNAGTNRTANTSMLLVLAVRVGGLGLLKLASYMQ